MKNANKQTNTSPPASQDTMMSFFTASPTEETNTKSSSNGKDESRSERQSLCSSRPCIGFACAHFSLFNDAMDSLCGPVLLFCTDGCRSPSAVTVRCAAVTCACWCVFAFTGATRFDLCRNLLFSPSHVALFLLFLLPLFPHLLLPCLLNEGTGKFSLHFLKM